MQIRCLRYLYSFVAVLSIISPFYCGLFGLSVSPISLAFGSSRSPLALSLEGGRRQGFSLSCQPSPAASSAPRHCFSRQPIQICFPFVACGGFFRCSLDGLVSMTILESAKPPARFQPWLRPMPLLQLGMTVSDCGRLFDLGLEVYGYGERVIGCCFN